MAGSYRVHYLPWLAGILPLITIHLTFLWAAYNGHVDWCLPYGMDCVSISASGRELPENYLFKALMIPSAMLIASFWLINQAWLGYLQRTGRCARVALLLGLLAAVGLLLYSAVLGAIGDEYRLLRRIGVTSFFGFTYLAQLLVLYVLQADNRSAPWRPYWLGQVIIGWLLLTLCIIAVVLSASFGDDYYDRVENGFEWTVTALLCGYVILSGFMWRTTGWRVAFTGHEQ